jgi:hypothetical protein
MILKSYWGAAELSLTRIGHAANAAKIGAESRPCFFDSREMPRVSALHSLLKPTRERSPALISERGHNLGVTTSADSG